MSLQLQPIICRQKLPLAISSLELIRQAGFTDDRSPDDRRRHTVTVKVQCTRT